MKKLLLTFLGIAVIFSLAFKNCMANKAAFNHKAAKWNDWGEWKVTSCYKGLDYRVKRSQRDPDSKGRYEWDVQFRNRYQDVINFNFKVAEPGYNGPTLGRQSVNENGTSNGNDWGLIANSAECQVVVDKVRFGADDDGSKPYMLCGDIYASVSSANSSIVNNPSGNSVVANNSSTNDQTTVNNSESPNNSVLNPSQHINNIQKPSADAIQQALAIQQTKINSRLNAGSTLQQQQQIQRVQQQERASTVENTAELAGGLQTIFAAIFNSSSKSSKVDYSFKADRPRIENMKSSIDPNVLYQTGAICSNNKDYTNANFFYYKAANLGSLEAMQTLASSFKYGVWGVKKNDEYSNYWDQKAKTTEEQRAAYGDIYSLLSLARRYYDRPKVNATCSDKEKALPYYLTIVTICATDTEKVKLKNDYGYTPVFGWYFASLVNAAQIYTTCHTENSSEKNDLQNAINYLSKAAEVGEEYKYYDFEIKDVKTQLKQVQEQLDKLPK